MNGEDRARADVEGDAQLVRGLEQLLTVVTTTRRNRSPVEAPIAYTQAYASMMFAYGFARLRRIRRARGLLATARASLREVIKDPIHAYLERAFSVRVDQAIVGATRRAPFPLELVEFHASLGRTDRYKADRLREASQILIADAVDEATDARWRIQQPEPGPRDRTFELGTIPEDRVAHVMELIEHVPADPEAAMAMFEACLAYVGALPEDAAIALLVEIVDAIEVLAEPPPGLFADALLAASAFGWGELAPRLLAPIQASFATLAPTALVRTLQPALVALRRLGLVDEIRAVIDSLAEETRLWGEPRAKSVIHGEVDLDVDLELYDLGPEMRAVWNLACGALASCGDPRGPSHLDRGAAMPVELTATEVLARTRRYANGYALAPIPTAVAGVVKIAERVVPRLTDVFGTNSHYNYTLLAFTDAVVLGIAEARVGIDLGLDGTPQL